MEKNKQDYLCVFIMQHMSLEGFYTLQVNNSEPTK